MTLPAMKMTDQRRKAEHFRALHIFGKPLLLFNIWDAGSAKAVAAAGAKVIATSSWSVANANESLPFIARVLRNAALASRVVASISIVLPFNNPSWATNRSSQVNTFWCASNAISRLVRDMVE
jgi:hypothetical protein